MASSISARYDRHAVRYGRWWGPVIEPTALAFFDRAATSLADAPPLRVLDVGTGTGVLAMAAVRRWPRAFVTGLDASEGMLEVAGARARRALTAEQLARLDWIRGVAEDLPFADAGFDLVV